MHVIPGEYNQQQMNDFYTLGISGFYSASWFNILLLSFLRCLRSDTQWMAEQADGAKWYDSRVGSIIVFQLHTVTYRVEQWNWFLGDVRETLLLSHFSRVQLCATPYTAAHQAPPSLGFSRQGHWSGLPFPSPMHESEKWKWSRPVLSNPQRPHGLQPSRFLHPWDFPGKNTGVGCHCLLWK